MPKVGKNRLPVLSSEQVKHTVGPCISQRDEALILFLLDTGVRSLELCSLTWGDIDLKTGVVRVRTGKGRKEWSMCDKPQLDPLWVGVFLEYLRNIL